jgi:hypothetical protein
LSFITIQISFKFNSDIMNLKFDSKDFFAFFLLFHFFPPLISTPRCCTPLSSPMARVEATSRVRRGTTDRALGATHQRQRGAVGCGGRGVVAGGGGVMGRR